MSFEGSRLPYPKFIHKTYALQIFIAEVIGTFFLTLVIVGAAGTHTDPVAVALAVMMIIVCVVYSFGYISKAQFNPCTTLAFFFTGVMSVKHSLILVGAEFLGAFLGALSGWAFLAGDNIPAPHVRTSNLRASQAEEFCRVFFAEFLFTFLLIHMILHVAASRVAGNEYYGVAIAFTVGTSILTIGHVSGAAMNPAVSFGLQLARCASIDCEALTQFWIFWLGQVFGAFAAIWGFLVIHGEACGGGCKVIDGTCVLGKTAAGEDDEDEIRRRGGGSSSAMSAAPLNADPQKNNGACENTCSSNEPVSCCRKR